MKLRNLLVLFCLAVPAVAFQPAAAQAQSPATKSVRVQPVRSGLKLAAHYKIVKTVKGEPGGSCTESDINPADLRCFATDNGVYDPCWPYRSNPSAPLAAVCPTSAASHKLVRISATGATSTSHSKKSYAWSYKLANGRTCYISTGAGDTFHGHPVRIYCTRHAALIGAISKSHRSWTVREVLYNSKGYRYGPRVHITKAYRASSYRLVHAGSSKPKKHSCTRTSGGSCIQGGEFCPKADYGQSGYDADGRRYICEGSSTHPHWEVP